MKLLLSVSSLPVMVLLSACGDSAAPPAATEVAKPVFTLQRLDELAVHPERQAPAAVIGRHEARISAEVAARVEALPVDVGQRVAKGALLIQLDPRDAQLALERAEAALAQTEARLAQAEGQLQRAQALQARNFYSPEALTLRETERTAAAADVRVARANRDTARRVLEKHHLRAPFAGVVRERQAQLGELASVGSVLLTLVSDGALEVSAQVQGQDVASLGQAGAWVFEAAGQTFPLKLLRISPATNRASRSQEVRFAFIEAAPGIGQSGRLRWHEPGNWLPADVLVRRDGRYGIFVAENGKAKFHALDGASEGRPIAVDLPETTKIVVQGRHALQDGAVLP